MGHLVVGVDVGGSNIRAALFCGTDMQSAPVSRRTPADPEAVVPQIVAAVREALGPPAGPGRPGEAEQATHGASTGPEAVGVGFPGVVDAEHGRSLYAGNLRGWRGGPVREWIEAELGLPVAVDNDVRAGGLGELCAGAGMGARSVVYVSIGTGVGGAVFIDGRAYRGSGCSAGEIGHMVLDASAQDALCRCGQVGDAEALVSGYAVEAAARRFTGRSFRATEVLEAGRRGEPGFREIHERVVRYLALLFGNVCAAFNPDRIVVGGGLGTEASYPVEAAWERFCRVAPGWLRGSTSAARAKLGPHSGITGAAVLALRRAGAS